MHRFLTRFVRDESGATAIEYGLIAALVSVAAIGALSLMGGSLDTMFTAVSGQLDSAVSAMPTTPPPAEPPAE
ncbi:MAG: Flp family type IVb pilin [Alphaproteobacteria bacterium]